MGTSRFAAQILEAILTSGYNVVSVYTQSSREEVGEIAKKNGIKILNLDKFDAKATVKFKSLSPELLIVASYGKILPPDILSIPKFWALNVHPSLLPEWRGPAPIQNAILAGKSETGATIMLMNEKVDAGEILAQVKFEIGQKETYPQMLEKSADVSAELLLKTIPLWIKKDIEPKKQDESRATYCQLIERSDGKINWSDSAQEIFDRWRALTPWPGTFTFFAPNGQDLRLKLIEMDFSAEADHGSDRKIGEVFEKDGTVFVATGKGAVALRKLQLEGKAAADIRPFLNGHKNFVGSILK
jgi:methionyl-tRNA formyltransferase